MANRLTAAQLKALKRMDDARWLSAENIGHDLGERFGDRPKRCGALVLGYLRRAGLVIRLKNGLWRITKAGRERLAAETSYAYMPPALDASRPLSTD